MLSDPFLLYRFRERIVECHQGDVRCGQNRGGAQGIYHRLLFPLETGRSKIPYRDDQIQP